MSFERNFIDEFDTIYARGLEVKSNKSLNCSQKLLDKEYWALVKPKYNREMVGVLCSSYIGAHYLSNIQEATEEDVMNAVAAKFITLIEYITKNIDVIDFAKDPLVQAQLALYKDEIIKQQEERKKLDETIESNVKPTHDDAGIVRNIEIDGMVISHEDLQRQDGIATEESTKYMLNRSNMYRKFIKENPEVEDVVRLILNKESHVKNKLFKFFNDMFGQFYACNPNVDASVLDEEVVIQKNMETNDQSVLNKLAQNEAPALKIVTSYAGGYDVYIPLTVPLCKRYDMQPEFPKRDTYLGEPEKLPSFPTVHVDTVAFNPNNDAMYVYHAAYTQKIYQKGVGNYTLPPSNTLTCANFGFMTTNTLIKANKIANSPGSYNIVATTPSIQLRDTVMGRNCVVTPRNPVVLLDVHQNSAHRINTLLADPLFFKYYDDFSKALGSELGGRIDGPVKAFKEMWKDNTISCGASKFNAAKLVAQFPDLAGRFVVLASTDQGYYRMSHNLALPLPDYVTYFQTQLVMALGHQVYAYTNLEDCANYLPPGVLPDKIDRQVRAVTPFTQTSVVMDVDLFNIKFPPGAKYDIKIDPKLVCKLRDYVNPNKDETGKVTTIKVEDVEAQYVYLKANIPKQAFCLRIIPVKYIMEAGAWNFRLFFLLAPLPLVSSVVVLTLPSNDMNSADLMAYNAREIYKIVAFAFCKLAVQSSVLRYPFNDLAFYIDWQFRNLKLAEKYWKILVNWYVKGYMREKGILVSFKPVLKAARDKEEKAYGHEYIYNQFFERFSDGQDVSTGEDQILQMVKEAAKHMSVAPNEKKVDPLSPG